MLQQAGNLNIAGDLYQQAAVTWGIAGEVDKAGDSFAKAAKEVRSDFTIVADSKVQVDRVRQSGYCDGTSPQRCGSEISTSGLTSTTALDLLCPSDIPEDQIKYTKPITTDVFRAAFVFALSSPDFAATALSLARRMVVYFRGVEQEVSMCRSMLAITLLLLKAGDVVAADKQFLDDLSESNYLHSSECRLAEAFLIAFKNYDLDALDAAQRSPDLHHQEREVIAFAKQLSLMTSHNRPESTVTPPTVPPANTVSAADVESDNEKETKGEEEDAIAAAFEQEQGEIQEEEDDDEIDLT